MISPLHCCVHRFHELTNMPVQFASCQIFPLSFPQIQLGCEDYLFPNLAALSFHLNQHSSPLSLPTPPQQDLLSQKKAPLFVSNMTPALAVHPSPSVLMEKLPSFIQVDWMSALWLRAMITGLLCHCGARQTGNTHQSHCR